MSILAVEYNEEIAKRVYAKEILEDRFIEQAKEMISDGEPVEKIVLFKEL